MFDRIVDRLYTDFLLRDTTFIVSGAMTLSVALPTPVDVLASAISGDKSIRWTGIVAFIALSYVLGVLLQEAARTVLEGIADDHVRLSRPGTTWQRRQVAMIEQLVQRGVSGLTVRGLERLVFLRQVAATQNATYAAILAILAVRVGLCSALWAAGLMVPAMILTAYIYCDKSLQLFDNYHELMLLP